MLPSSSDSIEVKGPPGPSPRLVMITLILVTFPVEIIFLSILRALGWLHLPFIFIICSVIFFCIAVRISFIYFEHLQSLTVHPRLRVLCFSHRYSPTFSGAES